ncbi:MAG: hypothetical protein ACLFS7_02640 [Desulfosudaceae bacterium]
MTKRLFPLILLLGALLLNGCALLPARRPPLPEKDRISQPARLALEELDRRNADLTSFKGVGKISVKKEGRQMQARLALMAVLPDKIRFEVLSPSGQPFMSLSTDGSDFYLRQRGDKERFIKKSARRLTLEKFLRIPVTAEDIIQVLAGRVPLIDYDTAVLAADSDQVNRLTIKDWSEDRREVIYLDQATGRPFRLEFFDGKDQQPVYSFAPLDEKNIAGYDIPEKILLSGTDGLTVTITLDRYWADITVPPDKFVLTDPRK